MTTLTVRLPEALKAALDEISRDENRAISDIVCESRPLDLTHYGMWPCWTSKRSLREVPG